MGAITAQKNQHGDLRPRGNRGRGPLLQGFCPGKNAPPVGAPHGRDHRTEKSTPQSSTSRHRGHGPLLQAL